MLHVFWKPTSPFLLILLIIAQRMYLRHSIFLSFKEAKQPWKADSLERLSFWWLIWYSFSRYPEQYIFREIPSSGQTLSPFVDSPDQIHCRTKRFKLFCLSLSSRSLISAISLLSQLKSVPHNLRWVMIVMCENVRKRNEEYALQWWSGLWIKFLLGLWRWSVNLGLKYEIFFSCNGLINPCKPITLSHVRKGDTEEMTCQSLVYQWMTRQQQGEERVKYDGSVIVIIDDTRL